MENNFLNYTHGSYLTNICNGIIEARSQQESTDPFKFIIEGEKRNLHNNKSSKWGHTESDYNYFEYLNKIHSMIDEEADEESYRDLIDEISAITRRKIHALFLTQEPACWPSLETVFAAAQSDPDYNATLVYTPFFHKDYSEQIDYFDAYEEMGVPVTRHDEYDLTSDSPDVVFMIKAYGNVPEGYEIKHLEKVVQRIVYIPYGMEISKDLIKFAFQYYLHYKAWRHCAYGEILKPYAEQYGYCNGENIAVWGHPKADHYRDTESNRENIPQEWKDFINGRKTILWTPHHLINLDGEGNGTWLIWGLKILQLAFENPDIAFIMRPHPLMFGALVNNGVMSQDELDLMIDRIKHSGNIMLDESASYHDAFNAADAIITDGTTFSIEFLYTKKPIMLTPRNMEGFYLYEQMMESYYIATDAESISDFINKIRIGDDPLEEKRLQLYKEAFYIPEDITVGENIINNVKKDLVDECSAPIDIEQYKQCTFSDEADDEELEENEHLFAPAVNDDKEKISSLPLMSVLVLCYKNKDLLLGMLNSIFMQDYPRIQLIVSDDGSADFNVDEITEYINKRKRSNIEMVDVIKNEVNMGTVKHINKAYKYIKGDYFIFTAADDRFQNKTVFTDYVNAFLDNEKAVWLVGRANLVTPDYKKTVQTMPAVNDKPFFQSGDPIKLYSRWCRRSMAIPCSMAFKANAVDLVGGFDLNYRYSEDWPLVLKLLRSNNMPIFLDKVTAIHSKGGITNSNSTYGVETRKAFYDDKYRLFKTEVKPYTKLMSKEDKKAYKQYMKEIMARHYFFFIDLPQATTKGQKIKLMLKKPIRAWWWFELKYDKIKEKVHKKKFFVAGHLMILLSLLFFAFNLTGWQDVVADVMAIFDLVIGFILLATSIITYPLEKYFKYKAALRQRLVN